MLDVILARKGTDIVKLAARDWKRRKEEREQKANGRHRRERN
jgi:hypothetical protein